MTQYVIGYRLHAEVSKTGRYNTPYFDITACTTLKDAEAIESQMIRDFGGLAEFRILQETWLS